MRKQLPDALGYSGRLHNHMSTVAIMLTTIIALGRCLITPKIKYADTVIVIEVTTFALRGIFPTFQLRIIVPT